MINPKDKAFTRYDADAFSGMSIREYMATEFCARAFDSNHPNDDSAYQYNAILAIKQADYLIRELNKEP